MKVSDYVIDFLVKRGVTDIFTVSGGGIMHLSDSAGRTPGMRYICNFHEQACAIAAESYARVRNGVGACLVTTGPGSTNALSGIAGAYVDSVPVVVISGQVRRELIADYSKLRQMGPQEINIDDMARPVVKYFKTLMDPKMARYEMECAWWHAVSGRPGPVWINIPLDVQAAQFDESEAVGFEAPPRGRWGRGGAENKNRGSGENVPRGHTTPGRHRWQWHPLERCRGQVPLSFVSKTGAPDAIDRGRRGFAGRKRISA